MRILVDFVDVSGIICKAAKKGVPRIVIIYLLSIPCLHRDKL